MRAYAIREGLSGFRRAKFAVLTATSAMAVALILIGLFGVVWYQARQVTDWMQQRVGELEVFIEDVPEPVALAIYERTKLVAGVTGAEYVSKAQAELVFRQEFGEESEVFLDEEFLPASVKLRVARAYANPDSLAAMGAAIKTWNRVDDVVFNQKLLAKVQQNLRLLTAIGLSLGIIIVLAALFLVANTIRLTIYARRLLIRTMKLVGATDKFIRQPFIVEGVVQGLAAGVLAVLTVWSLYLGARAYVPQLMPVGAGLIVLSVFGLLSMGVLLGWAGSMIAARRFIRTVSLH